MHCHSFFLACFVPLNVTHCYVIFSKARNLPTQCVANCNNCTLSQLHQFAIPPIQTCPTHFTCPHFFGHFWFHSSLCTLFIHQMINLIVNELFDLLKIIVSPQPYKNIIVLQYTKQQLQRLHFWNPNLSRRFVSNSMVPNYNLTMYI